MYPCHNDLSPLCNNMIFRGVKQKGERTLRGDKTICVCVYLELDLLIMFVMCKALRAVDTETI